MTRSSKKSEKESGKMKHASLKRKIGTFSIRTLKFYRWQENRFRKLQYPLLNKEVKEIVSKLSRAFKVPEPRISFASRKERVTCNGAYHGLSRRIVFRWRPELLSVLHEFSHHVDLMRHFKEYGDNGYSRWDRKAEHHEELKFILEDVVKAYLTKYH